MKALHFVLSVLIMGFTFGLVYLAAIATQQAVNETNEGMFAKAVTGRLTDPVFAGLKEKLKAYKTVAQTMGDIYKEEKVQAWKAASTPSQTTGYMLAAIGLQKAWMTELIYIYISYKVTDGTTNPDLWGDCGCEVGPGKNAAITCYYMDNTGTRYNYDSANMTGTPTRIDYNQNVVNYSYVQFAADMTETGPQGNGGWQAPYIFVDPVINNSLPVQLVTYTYPVEWDALGNCVAAAQVDFTLSHAEVLLLKYLPTPASHMVLINSKGNSPDGTGVFVASTNQSLTPTSDTEVFPAMSTKNPYPWVYEMLVLTVANLKTTYNFLNVTGNFQSGGVYYEAATVDAEWTIVLKTPMSYFYTSDEAVNKAKAGSAKPGVWSDKNTIGIIALAVCIGIFAIVNLIVGCCCDGASAARKAPSAQYLESVN